MKPTKEAIDVHLLLLDIDKECLGDFPTPLKYVQINDFSGFWVKDEGRSHCLYGGNKVRKLEYLFAWAKKKGVERLVVWGGGDSHTVEAVSILGQECGFSIYAIVYQDSNFDELCNISGMNRDQIIVHKTRNFISAYIHARLNAIQPKSVYVPLGATTSYSSLGHVSAACELVKQWQASNELWPEAVYLAMGSGGTVVGLAVGFALLGAPIKLNAVQTVDSSITNERTLLKQIKNVLRLLGLSIGLAKSILSEHINVDRRYLGKGYGDISQSSLDAVSRASAFDLDLEPVFTGKVMAAIFHDLNVNNSLNILYWHTHNNAKPS